MFPGPDFGCLGWVTAAVAGAAPRASASAARMVGVAVALSCALWAARRIVGVFRTFLYQLLFEPNLRER